jgi:hypothetical protein
MISERDLQFLSRLYDFGVAPCKIRVWFLVDLDGQ